MASANIHPELRKAALVLPRDPVRSWNLPAVRIISKLVHLRPGPAVEVVAVSPDVSVRIHRPARPVADAALLWIHGGGYVLGTAQMDDQVAHHYAKSLRIPVVSVEYRLAPEHPYPVPVEDCYTALRWLTEQPWVDPTRIAIGGASAGGGLTAALALLARDRGEITPAFQLLVYPMIDDRTAERTDIDESAFRLWGNGGNRFGWNAYLGNTDRDKAVPARRQDLAGLPPAWVGVGSADLFLDEDMAYAKRLKAAGVPCTLKVIANAFHGFDQLVIGSSISKRFFESQFVCLRKALDL